MPARASRASWRSVGSEDRSGEAAARTQLAAAEILLGRLGQARRELDRALVLAEELRAPDHIANVLSKLGVVDYREGDYASARSCFLRVVDLQRELGDLGGEADARYELATIDIAAGDRPRAAEEVERIVALRQQLGDSEGEEAARRLLDE